MRIVIDLQGAQTESRYRGIGRYSLSLAKAMVRNRGNHEIIIVLSGLFPDSLGPIRAVFDNLLPQDNICVWYAPGPVRASEPGNTWRNEAAELIREAFIASLQPDIVHITSLFEGYVDDAVISIGCFDKTTPVSVSLYDLIPLLNPDYYLKQDPVYELYYLQKIDYMRRSSLPLAISEYSRREGMDHLSQHVASIVNISTAAETHFRPLNISETEAQILRDKFSLSRPFVFYSGGADKRKNLPRLIRAYAQLSDELRNKHQLVFAGKLPEGNIHQLQKDAKAAGLRFDELVFTGYVVDDELVKLYNLCTLYVFPSWHEGFGLPALEAMSCGAAVIGSNTTSLPEVIGNVDAIFDPFSEEDIVDKITSVLTNEDFRQSLIEHGLNQAKKFSWDKSAKVAIDAFEKMSRTKEKSLNTRDHSMLLIAEIAKIRTADRSSDTDIAETAKCIDLNYKSMLQYKQSLGMLTWRIEGPFDSSYSLALLNRETALALYTLGYEVALHSTEGPGDFDPDPVFLTENPILNKLHTKSNEIMSSSADIISRNLFPPRVEDMKSPVRMLHHYAWEESGFPQEWVKKFNTHLDGMTCLSQHVQKIMIDNGVHIPMQISGCGVDHWERITASSKYRIKAKQFKFLHVSSCFPRKGVDCLLKAYGEEFTSTDDVSLVIKTFPNPHNKIYQWLEDARLNNLDYPDVVIIEKDLNDSELKALYELCDVLVSPTCAEGFGLPMAEAMLTGVPVITTAWSGQLDFCNKENSWLVDYEFERAQSHFDLFSSVWVKPNVGALAKAMCEVYNSTPELRASKARAGRRFLLENFKWTDVASRYVNAISDNLQTKVSHSPKIAWLSTWNTRCGIAAYSEHLIKNLPSQNVVVFAPRGDSVNTEDRNNCVRNWTIGKEHNNLNEVTEEIELRSINTIVIQFNYGFYNHQELGQFIEENVAHGRNVIMVFHSTVDPEDKLPQSNFKLQFILSSLKLCHRILAHSVADLNRLKKIGLVENVALFPHGVLNYTRQTPFVRKLQFILSSLKLYYRVLVYSVADLNRSKKTSLVENAALFPHGVLKYVRQTPFVKMFKLPLIASYGFCLPHKGLEELIDAVAILRKQGSPVCLRLVNAEYPAPESRILINRIEARIKNLNLKDLVEFNYQFLDDSESLELLSAADLIVFPYQQTGESSSAAVRYGMASTRPVAVTPLQIFDDLSNATFRFAGTNSASIASGISEILESLSSGSEDARNIQENADRWRNEFDYAAVGVRLYGICSALLQQKHC